MKYILASILLIILSYSKLLNPIRDIFSGFVSPVQYGLNRLANSIKDSTKFYLGVSKLKSDNMSLYENVYELESKLAQLKILGEENKILREQLEISDEVGESNLIVATVMGNPNDPTGSTLILNSGQNKGIKVGNIVIRKNYLIGIVREVWGTKSKIELVTSPNVKFTVKDIDSPTLTEGLATGSAGISILVERILQSEKIAIGDIIVTSGKDGLFPPDLIVGKVVNISNNESEPLMSATLETIYDFTKLDKVFISVE